jgi:hypothetical protein
MAYRPKSRDFPVENSAGARFTPDFARSGNMDSWFVDEANRPERR